MHSPSPASAAARLLAEHRRGLRPFGGFPDSLRPADAAAGYAIQDALHAELDRAGAGPITGWKIGCTTPVMQAFLGIDTPCAGGMPARTMRRRAVHLPRAACIRPGVECEIAVVLGASLPADRTPYRREDVARAVVACMVAIEIVDDRYDDYRKLDTPTLLADDFFHAGIVLGDPVRDWRRLDLANAAGTTRVSGREAGRGHGADVMGHPFVALAWLANHLAARGRPLRAGDVVTTGSVVETRWLDPGDVAEATIEGLGTARLTWG